ncbi:MAG: HD domain-containing protein [Deltaproteobacteria bacterium]|nr:HD domain-containing protein [Deltaproteobacteria bacterium]
MQRQISVNLGNILLSLSEIMDIANPSIAQHQQRTAFIALEITKDSAVGSEIMENIFTASLLHDIGAISIEEKIAIHNFETEDNTLHCIRGELLLEKTPWLKKISKIVRHHHRNWKDWNDSIDTPDVFASQVILLSDYIERLIDRNKYILHQNKDIIEKVTGLKNTIVHERIIDFFIEASKREEFWLDLVSPRLYPVLLHNGPYRNVEIDLKGIALIAEVYKDIIDFKSTFTATHTTGVSASAEILSKLFGLTEHEINLIKIAGNMHDIGKLIIPNNILEKPDKLTKEELAVIRCHTYYSYYVINTIGGLQQIAEWAAYHHEKLDGNGYPFHCKEEEIDTGARIMTVADIFTAISEDRPYRAAMNKEEVYKTIKDMSNKKLLDSKIVDLLFDNYDIVNIYAREKQSAAKDFYQNRFLKVLEQTKQ